MIALSPLAIIAFTWILQAEIVCSTPIAGLEKRTARTSPPSGCLVVRGTDTESGEYSTLLAAIDALGSSTDTACIFMYGGTYAESLRIDYGGALTLYAYTTDYAYQEYNTVTIENDKSSEEAGDLDDSSAINVVSSGFRAYNINFSNTYGVGAQAVALTANGDEQGFYACGFYGYQDTLYAKAGKQYYSNCYIEGAVDYIFGAAAAWFGECTIASNGGGAITANSRDSTTDTTWYVIDSSMITAASGYSLEEKVYLGRPWRQYARVIFQNSVLTAVVNPAGWTTLAANATPIFEEYDNTGAGSSTADRVEETAASEAVSKTDLWGNTWADWIDTTW